MFRFKVLLLSLLAVMAVGSVASTAASAALEGPWWRHPEGANQVKWPLNEEHEVKSKNEGAFQLKGILGTNTPVTIKCNLVTDKGNIWNGSHQGEDKTNVLFEECSVVEPCPTAVVTVSPVEAYTELMWKYKGNDKEELTKIGQQKIYDAFAPTEEAKEGKAIFTNITLKGPGLCTGTFAVRAAGTPAIFTDQEGISHKIVWGTAALVEPQNHDATVGHLTWLDPNQRKLHHQETPIEAKLTFGGNPAELQGTIRVELNTLEEFGAFNE